MSINIGPPVSGANFFGRDEYILKFLKLIKMGMSILLSGPRRVGKTSLALQLINKLKNENWHCIYITVEGVRDVSGFVNRIIEAMKKDQNFWNKSSNSFGKFFRDLNIDINIGPVKLSKKSKESTESLLLEALSKSIEALSENVFIVIDELPVFLRSIEKNKESNVSPDQILEHLRAIRQNSISTGTNNVVWMFSGSISLEHFAASRNLSYAINDLQSNMLGAFSESDAIHYLNHLCMKYNISMNEEVKIYFLNKIKWHIPFFINILFDALQEIKNGNQISIEQINDVFLKCLEKYKKEFDYQIQRLLANHDNSDQYIEVLKSITKFQLASLDSIKALFSDTEWRNIKENDLLNIIDLLEHDGYITNVEGGYTFRSPFMRDFIKNKYHLR